VSRAGRQRLTDGIPSTAARDGERKSNRFFVTVNLRRQVVRSTNDARRDEGDAK
jgi:hypothetical protein